jgi:hypothetical protein
VEAQAARVGALRAEAARRAAAHEHALDALDALADDAQQHAHTLRAASPVRATSPYRRR